MQLNQAQKAAVEYLDGPLLVLAGPGTGKTQLLSSRVAYILQHTDVNPENILCITFTENGAANMRERLTSIIGKDAQKIHIHTYHAFGSNILSAYKNYAESFDRVLDSSIDEVTQFKIIKNILDKLSALDILKTANVKDICSTIKSAKDARLTPDDLATIAKSNIAESAELSSAISDIFQNLVPRMKYNLALEQVYIPIAQFLATTNNKPILKNIAPLAQTLALDLAEAIQLAEDTKKLKPLSDWKEKNFEKDAAGNYRLKNHIANKKLASFANVMSQYNKHLADNGLFDFSDMIEEAITILKNDDGFRLTLSETYQYILLDEFQDTNPSQFELIKLLTAVSDRPDIMAVGDDDQAIFEFQGANASNLSDFKTYYSSHVINLTDNYRSTSEILDFSHHIAEQIPDSFAKKHGVQKILHAMKNLIVAPGKSNISRHEFLTSEAEYYWVASQISQLIKSGTPQKSIAIITPKHKYITPLLPYLKSFDNINISYEKKDNLLEHQQLSELLRLACFIYDIANNKTSSHRLLEILSFPFLKVSPLAAIKATEAARHDKRSALDYLKNSEDPHLQTLGLLFATLAVKSFDAPLELFLDYLTGSVPITLEDGTEFRSAFIETYAQNSSAYSTFELYENLSIIKEKIKSHTNSPNPKLTDLVTFLNDYKDAEAPLINSSPYQDSADSVQILTAHKSKGLEFEHVFLIATDNRSWGKSEGNNNMFVLPKNLLQIRHTNTTDGERLRLFFVALTRAKTTLTITNSIKDFSGKSPSRLDYLEEYIDEAKNIISPYLPSPAQHVVLHYEDLDTARTCTDLRPSWISAYLSLTPDLKSLLKKRLERYAITASDLTSFIDIIYSGPLDFYRKKILHAPSEPANESIMFGNLIHSTFENVTNHHLSDTEAIDFFRTEAENAILDPQQRTNLLEKGPADLEIALNVFGDILREPNSRAEVDLFHEHLSIDGIPITGKIDHISIDPEEKTIEIYDFKTSKFRTGKWESDPTLYKYALQLGFYKLLLNSSPTFSKYHISKAHILFVTPDQNERQVHIKTFDFTDDFEQELITLTKSVFAHIKSLDFLTDPELAIEPNQNLKMQNLKDFISLILAKTPKIS